MVRHTRFYPFLFLFGQNPFKSPIAVSLWGYALQVSNLEGGICFEITQIWRISCADQPGFKVQCLLRFAFIGRSVFHYFLVNTHAAFVRGTQRVTDRQANIVKCRTGIGIENGVIIAASIKARGRVNSLGKAK